VSASEPGSCKTGVQRCENGKFGSCITAIPAPERCNGLDDDCDDAIDEDSGSVCYPPGFSGCTVNEGRAPDCKGSCAPGVSACRDGKVEPCTGARVPQSEVCTASGAAADENCDGNIDEVCACMPGEPRSCYSAAPTTLNVGKCVGGTQVCENGRFGPCVGAVAPQAESCANSQADDDCDGVVDNIALLGTRCAVDGNQGACRTGRLECRPERPEPTCVTPAPAAESCNSQDDDCDGKTDETFDLQGDSANCGACNNTCGAGQNCCAGRCTDVTTDNANCGGCGADRACAAGSLCCDGQCANTQSDGTHCGSCTTVCAAGDTCCAGQCANTRTDVKNCGGCGAACSMGTQPGCCEGLCVDFLSQDNCGSCGHVCGVVADGVTCTCGTTAEGTVCIAPVLGVCL